MKRLAFDPSGNGEDAPAQRTRGPMQCVADDCKWRASASFGGAPFACIAHQGVEDARDWPIITQRTAELHWLADFIADTQRAVSFPKPKASPWHVSAAQFFGGSDYPWLAPTPDERSAPTLYLYRMLAEARHMAQGKPRPAAFVPHCDSADWRKAQRRPVTTGDDE